MEFSNSGGLRSPFSPRVRQSITGRRPIGIASTKSHSKYMQSPGAQAGDVIYKAPFSTIETFGLPLPVLVTEALTFASGEVSVRLSPCGWCWLVVGRRVLAWPRELRPREATASPAAPAPSPARDLTLPQTDLAHKADLVLVYYEEGSQMPSMVGVSPEGVVRYWPSVGQEGAYVDVGVELGGQECDRLALAETARNAPRARSLLLATTTCTVVQLNPAVVEGRACVAWSTLRAPAGWLGGLGRRVSLLFFGTMPHHHDTKLVGVVSLGEEGAGADDGGGGVALVSRGPALQVWRGGELHEHALRRPLLDALPVHHLHLPHIGEGGGIEVVALDVRRGGPHSLLLLVAAVSVARPPDLRYALAHISVEEPASPRVTSMVPLRWPRDDADEPPRFLPLGPRLLLYTSKHLAILSSSVGNDKAELIDVSAEGDRILGAEVCGGLPLLFSRKHGVLALFAADAPHLAHAPSSCESPLGSPGASDAYDGNLSLYELDPHEMSMVCADACGKLKTAFLFHVRRESEPCRALLAELFPVPPGSQHGSVPGPQLTGPLADRDVDAPLDRTVLAVATEMLDDMPAGDPRWRTRGCGASNIALGASAALQPGAQLADKQRAFALYVEFLRATGLWNRLGLVSNESGESGCEGLGCRSTVWALGGLGARLAAARALLSHREGPHRPLVDAAIQHVVCGEQSDFEEDPEVEAALSSGALSPADVCFRRVSRCPRVLLALARASSPPAPPDAARHAAATMHILTNVLGEMQKCQSAWEASAPSPPPPLGPRALLPALADLLRRAITECAHKCGEATLRAQVLDAAAALADSVLAAADHLQRSPRTQHLYEKMRTDVILPFLREGQRERAAALADKFRDFELLIEMCVDGDELDRLYSYIDKYIDQGMAERTFAWLCERGGRERALLVRALGGRLGARLSAWLQAVPERRDLLALHHLCEGQRAPAAHLLVELADEETTSVNKMTTMASLAKLCLLSSEDPVAVGSPTWLAAEARLQLGEQHSALPRDIRRRHGLDEPDTRVLSPEELVQMYVESSSGSLSEFDYKKALDLTEFVADAERRDDLRLRVWCASILHDSWSACGVDAPADALRERTFFRLIDLVHVMGGDLALLLPAVEDVLTAPELAELVSDARLRYLIQYGYQCLHDTSSSDTHPLQVAA